ncbi:MAG TPA: type II toxin-antitoxin system VapC family toxin [Mycobacteriales bacterium]|nr:type II toxin-antitoxin system VapC family toxin [Mycobacteriales bacterium]
MILCDVNVLLHAHKRQSPAHEALKPWLLDALNGDEPVGVSDLVLAAVVRIATNRRAFDPPSTLAEAQAFVQVLWENDNAIHIHPGQRHWGLFTRICREVGATANLVPDAYLAALAIEHGCEWITTDRGFARFPGLRWRNPLDPTP